MYGRYGGLNESLGKPWHWVNNCGGVLTFATQVHSSIAFSVAGLLHCVVKWDVLLIYICLVVMEIDVV
jgi:hypothetical protein